MKSSISFVCQECGYESAQWMGKCPECNEWNSLKEFRIKNSESRIKGEKLKPQTPIVPKTLKDVIYQEKSRLKTGFLEADGVLGGGIVPGSVVLLAGDPGIGKSTLLLQMALNISNGTRETKGSKGAKKTSGASVSPVSSGTSVLYISGEESEQQIKLRANRIGDGSKNDNLLLLSLTDTDAVVSVVEEIKPDLVIVDSIQTMESEGLGGLSGSVGQVRYATSAFIKVAKSLNIPFILVGHVTKGGMVAGPMVLSHMVDTVLFLEGEKNTGTRILRSLKNRFGPVDEVGVFTMQGEGMKEIKNPEQIFLSEQSADASGSVLTVTLEGTRAFLVEIQALAVYSKLPMPRRVASGIDYKRLELLLAVLQKHCRLPVDTMDIFVNVAGGLKLSDPAADLGICLAVYSSLKNVPLKKTIGIAEVGLLGELRSVNMIEKRIKQAKKLGFKNIITAETQRSLNNVLRTLG
ncbi:MAG: DNA repair protein RadA [Candidatus Levybacteria bacterium CG_4_9_14_3_um_filter_35_16]|nr:MAG: DNA repair protein RadA [Candidatus Levybacteria bacterium CG22_combo_CG10-13_8_21_14_all_35_11]PJA91591.1 MAG: DNA repair protein RadA [Candidatus Levybacteria bacterium CG_4_9_14_3_um_filter_35_16]PJC54502.1 MAG: DNA repair protein RadA [Candidatus Levybacteria bacterium CG_4_9_14_0_2_um_filter_35_21]